MGFALTVPAMAQSVGAPASSAASNIDRADTRSDIAPSLPVPPVAANAGPRQYLQAAKSALSEHRTGEAQEALERAEARLLDRSTVAPGVDNAPMVKQIGDARDALGHGDIAGAARFVDAALATRPRTVATAMPMPPSTLGTASGASGTPGAIGAPLDDHRDPITRRNATVEHTDTGSSGDRGLTAPRTRENPNANVGPAVDGRH
jgi:hypothetical protein